MADIGTITEDSGLMDQEDPRPPSRGLRWAEGIAVFLIVAAWQWFAITSLAMGWDEGYTVDRVMLLESWWSDSPRDFNSLERRWRFSKAEPDGHGPAYALVSLCGRLATRHWLDGPDRLDPLASYRIGPALLFTLAVTGLFSLIHSRWDRWAAWLAVGLLMLQPRLQPEVAYALVDGPLVSFTLLACVGLIAGDQRTRPWAIVLFGTAWGLALATKLTGWLLVVPFLGYAMWRNTRSQWLTLGAGTGIAAAVLFGVNVGWWRDPLTGVAGFLQSNMTRADTIPIATLFLGTRYPFSLPWYNTLVWLVFAMPILTLALALVGTVSTLFVRQSRPEAMLFLLIALTILTVRALPQAPGHDGVRQLALAFATLPIVAAFGLLTLGQLCEKWAGTLARGVCVGLLAMMSLAESAWSVAGIHPLQLSYYSPLIGGLPGAAERGMEPTYFWDSFDQDSMDWLAGRTTVEEWVLFANNPTSLDHLRRWGRLRVATQPLPGRPCRWYVLQSRPGLYRASDNWLIRHAEPARVREHAGVPLLRIYSGEDWLRAIRATQPQPMKSPANEDGAAP